MESLVGIATRLKSETSPRFRRVQFRNGEPLGQAGRSTLGNWLRGGTLDRLLRIGERLEVFAVLLRQIEHKAELLEQHGAQHVAVGPEHVLENLALEFLERRQTNAFGAAAYFLLEAVVQLNGERLVADELNPTPGPPESAPPTN